MDMKERFCWYCGDSLGFLSRAHWQHGDTCGKPECDREALDQAQYERDEAHSALIEAWQAGWDAADEELREAKQ